MSAESRTLVFTQTVKTSIAQVFRAFTNSTLLREWFCDTSVIEPKAGGRFYFRWNAGFYASGHFLAFQPNESFSLFWNGRDEPTPTTVTVSFSEEKGATLVRVEQQGVGIGPEWRKTIEEIEKGWVTSLENLTSVLDTGEDQRFTRRPMLGIMTTDFNPEVAVLLGVPVTQGIRLDGTIEGMGARKAGLLKDDVVIQLAGKEVVDWGSLAAALQSHSAGDTVEVVFYRGSERKTTPMTLSGRPVPPMPQSLNALVEIVRKRVKNSQVELDLILKAITDAEASKRPAPEEWNVKEVIAHLIHGERGYQEWLSEVVTSQEPHYDDFGGNIHARVQATVAVFPTLEDLRLEFERVGKETIELFERLPESFRQQKATYWRVAYGETGGPLHLQTHLAQIKAAIEFARQ